MSWRVVIMCPCPECEHECSSDDICADNGDFICPNCDHEWGYTRRQKELLFRKIRCNKKPKGGSHAK